MTINANAEDGPTGATRAAAWIAALRESEVFFTAGAVVLIFSTIAVVAMHTASYAANVHNGLSFGGAVVGLVVPLALVTTLALLYGSWPRGRWFAATGGVTLLVVFFAVLPPTTARTGWLSVLLFVLVTLVYEAAVVSFVLVVQPWAYLAGAPFGTRENSLDERA
jgi:hypothetical protein